tara:strand:- start:1317 stop:1493 length:177 start_codon:yes stop_codon:yes gene_type:complete
MESSSQTNNEELEKKYIESFTKNELKAYEIAKSHLEMSFDLNKSIGFQEWKKKQTESK